MTVLILWYVWNASPKCRLKHHNCPNLNVTLYIGADRGNRNSLKVKIWSQKYELISKSTKWLPPIFLDFSTSASH